MRGASDESQIEVSIVIPTCDRREDLFRCLGCVESYFAPSEARAIHAEVLIADDGSEAGLESALAVRFPWARYLKGPRRGPAANRNCGAARAGGKWLVFTDDDCLPQRGWLEGYLARCDGRDVLEGRTSAWGERRRADEECPVNETGGYLWSCNFAIRTDVFHRLGGFDEGFPTAAMEDVDLRIRLNELGCRIEFAPEALVLHPWRREKGIAFKKQKAKSSAFLARKHPSYRQEYLVRRILYRLVKSLAKSVFRDFWAFKGRGVARSIGLNIAHSFCLIKEIGFISRRPS